MMKIKFFSLLFLLFKLSCSQLISCEYDFVEILFRQKYVCNLKINNPEGWNNFTSIPGDHLPGLGNVNVTGIISHFSESLSFNIPQIICLQFSQATFIDLSMEVQQVDSNAFLECINLEKVRLFNNRISKLPENLFIYNEDLENIDIELNFLETLPENIFEHQSKLLGLEMGRNPINFLPSGIFKRLSNLRNLYMENMQLTNFNPQWFENLTNLEQLELSRNPLESPIPANIFQNLENLQMLFLSNLNITEINPTWFQNLRNLEYLFINGNSITSILPRSFENLNNLIHLNIEMNYINHISDDAFMNLENIVSLNLNDNLIIELNPSWFQTTSFIYELSLENNSINLLPRGIFSSLNVLEELRLMGNNLRTVNRNSFGSLEHLRLLDLDENSINSVDESIFDDAIILNNLYFYDNICASRTFNDFSTNRVENIRALGTCINNFRFVVDIQTEPNRNYIFFAGRQPGILVHVTTNEEVNIALTPFDFPWTPMIEIFISVANNTESRIVRNRQTVVVTVPTPNILRSGQWNGFRITWTNHAILVTREGQQFPFMAYTLEDFFPVNFYGLRSPQSQAAWNVEPIFIPTPH